MEIGNLLVIIFCVLAIFVIVARTALSMIYSNAPVLKSPLFRVYRNNSYNPKLKSDLPIYKYEYRCILSKEAIKKFGEDINIVGFGDTENDAYTDAATKLNEYLLSKGKA